MFEIITVYILVLKFFLNLSNGVNVDGATHKQVVDLIKLGGDTLNLIGNYIYF